MTIIITPQPVLDALEALSDSDKGTRIVLVSSIEWFCTWLTLPLFPSNVS